MKVVEIGVSPKQMSKLRNGHNVRVKRAMEGQGICMIVNPSKYDIITRAFSRGKGVEVSLSPEEIMTNLNASPQMEGRGVFGKKVDKFVEKKIGTKAKDKLYTASKALKPVISKGIDLAAAYAPELGASALSGLALMAGQPELVPIASQIGSKLGAKAGQKGSVLAKDYLNNPGEYQDKVNKRGSSKMKPTPMVSSNMVEELNDSQGTNMGYMERAGLASANANKQRAMMLRDIQEAKFRQMYPNSNISEAEIDKVFDVYPSGNGLYAGKGLYASQSGRGMMPLSHMGKMGMMPNRNMKNLVEGRGIAKLPQAMTSQPYDANFQFRHTLPPAYQMVGKGLYA